MDVCPDSSVLRIASGGFDTFLKIWPMSDPSEVVNGAASDDSKPSPAKKKRKQFLSSEKPADCLASSGSKSTAPLVTLAEHSGAITGLVWSVNNPLELWTASWDQTIRSWDLELSGPKSRLAGPESFTCLDVSPTTGLLLTGSCDPYIRLWDPRSKEGAMVKTVFRSHSLWVSAVRWSRLREHCFLSGSYDQSVKMWDTRSPSAPLFNLSGHSDKVLSACWDVAEDRILSGGADSLLNIYQVPS